MIDLGDVRAAFPALQNVAPLGSPSGQKDVLVAELAGQPVVLKLIKPTQDRQRVQREIAAAAKLACAYVPKVMDEGERTIGHERRVYVIEERIDGETLSELLRRQPVRSLVEVLRLLETLLLACRDFEAAKLVHRDIKPENLIVDRAGKLWVIDFGIVRLLDEPALTPSANRFGLFTPGYGAPEQVRNLRVEIDSRADLFSVGVVAYEALNGSNPYWAGNPNPYDVLQRVLARDLPRLNIPGDTGGALADLLTSMTSRYPSRRPQTVTEALSWFSSVKMQLAPSGNVGP